jgi:sugar lactone lactonase YvrE
MRAVQNNIADFTPDYYAYTETKLTVSDAYITQDANLNFYFTGTFSPDIWVIPGGGTGALLQTPVLFHQQSQTISLNDSLGVGSDGNIYFWDYDNQTMDVYDPTGNLIRTFAVPAGYTALTITFDNQGHFFLANTDGSGFSVFDLNGDLLGSGAAPPLPTWQNSGRPLLATDNAGHLFEFQTSSSTINEFSYDFATPEPSTECLLMLGLVAGAFCRIIARARR